MFVKNYAAERCFQEALQQQKIYCTLYNYGQGLSLDITGHTIQFNTTSKMCVCEYHLIIQKL